MFHFRKAEKQREKLCNTAEGRSLPECIAAMLSTTTAAPQEGGEGGNTPLDRLCLDAVENLIAGANVTLCPDPGNATPPGTPHV